MSLSEPWYPNLGVVKPGEERRRLPENRSGMNTRVLLPAAVILTVVAAGVCLAAPAGDVTPLDLLGYGRLEVTREPGAVVIACENAARADTLLSKLRADLTWDELTPLQAVQVAPGVPGLAGDDWGVLVLARKGARVLALTGAANGEVVALVQRYGLGGKDTVFTAGPHPAWLDSFDLRPWRMGEHYFWQPNLKSGPWARFERDSELYRYTAWNDIKVGMGADVRWYMADSAPADGVEFTYPMEYELGLVRAAGQDVDVHFGAWLVPWWIRSKFPGQMVQIDPYATPGWLSADSVGNMWPSHWCSDELTSYLVRSDLATLDAAKRAGGDSVAFIRVGTGRPGDEEGMHSLSTDFMYQSEADQAGYRRWLQETRKLDLAGLGQRWYGDPGHFKAWEEVRVPTWFEFFGGFDPKGVATDNLLTDWRWHLNQSRARTEKWWASGYAPGEEAPGGAWVKLNLAPSLRQYYLDRTHTDPTLPPDQRDAVWLRQEFDPTAWLRAHPGQQVYLVANTYDTSKQPVEVYLNDLFLGEITPQVQWQGPIGLRVTGLVHEGRNVLTLLVQGGYMHGPVFLTTEQPRRYPEWGPQKNARWVDLRDFEVDSNIRGWMRQALPVREHEQEMPMLFVPGGALELADHFLEIKQKVGISGLHNSGSGGSYRPWWPGFGYALGIYGSTEEGGTMDSPDGQSAQLAWLLYGAEGQHNFVYDSLQYLEMEKKTHWFSDHRREMELFGKADPAPPEVAVLISAATCRYFPGENSVGTWDIGRGELQAAHYSNAYVSETEVKAGLADQFPVLFDSASMVLDDDTLAGIEKYVRAGGIFVAMNATGRNSVLEADTWPITRLTGYKVLGERQAMMVTVDKDNPVLKHLAGATANGEGVAVNWMGVDHANRPVALEAVADGCVPLAHWEDGTVAAGMRTLGQGKVVVLGSTFWRGSSDRLGGGITLNASLQTVFLNDLLEGLGVPRQVDCNREEVWARRLVTKNGLQDWIVLYNPGRLDRNDVEISLPYPAQPRQVTDMVSGQAVPSDYAGGQVRVKGLAVGANQVRMLGVDRAGFGPALDHWLAQKAKYNARPEGLPREAPPLKLPPATAIALSNFRFRMADATAQQDLSWTTAPTTGPEWKDVSYGFWDELGYPAKGIGLYRTVLNIPAQWRGRPIQLGFCSYDDPIFFEKATVYLNGQLLGEYPGHGWWNFDLLEITGQAHPGPNQLAVLVESTLGRGGYFGQLLAFAQEPLEQVITLTDGWKLYSDDVHFVPSSVPTTQKGRNLATEVPIPAAWQGRQVYLVITDAHPDLKHYDRSVKDILVNDRPMSVNQVGHPFRGTMQFNITALVKPGQVNRIELWMAGIPGEIRAVQVGVSKQ